MPQEANISSGGSQQWTVADAVVNAIVAVVEDIRTDLVAPVSAIAVIAQSIGRARPGGLRIGAGFVQRFALIGDDFVVARTVVWTAVIENGAFNGAPEERREQEGCHHIRRGEKGRLQILSR